MEFHDLLDAPMPRRTVLLGTGLAALLAACSSSATTTTTATTTADPATSAAPATEAPPTTTSAATTTATPAAPTTEAEVVTSANPVIGGVAALAAADFEGMATCALAPQQTAGPFPLDEQLDRSDITEGVAGHPLRLGLRVLDTNCQPVPDAKVEIWHTDSTGDYSAFTDNGGGKDDGPGTTFCRGTQSVNAEGIAEFLTVYPGWYPGRAVHIHLRVHVADNIVLTSQLFFDDAYSAEIYTEAPYAEFGQPNMLTAQDRIAGDAAGDGTILVTSRAQTPNGPGSIALHNLGIDPTSA